MKQNERVNINVLPTVMAYAQASVFSLEQLIPQSGQGQTKKQIILEGVKTLLSVASVGAGALAGVGVNVGTNQAISEMTAAVSAFIDATVASLNKNKVFPVTATPVTASPASPAKVA